jgi:hypothetical protein
MLVYYMAVWSRLQLFWCNFSHFGIFFPVLVCCTEKNLAALVSVNGIEDCGFEYLGRVFWGKNVMLFFVAQFALLLRVCIGVTYVNVTKIK